MAVGHLREIDPTWVAWVKTAADSINVVTDQIDGRLLRSAQETVRGAGIVCFLGFQYQQNNLRRLEIPRTLTRTQNVFGSAYGLEVGDREGVVRRVGHGIQLGAENQDCRAALGQFDVFRG